MKAFVFLLSLVMVGCTLLPWRPLNTFQETFMEAKLSAERAVESVHEILRNRTEDSYNFIRLLENSPMIKALFTEDMESWDCWGKFDNMKKRFRNAYDRLDVPIIERVAEIKQRISGIYSKILYYQSVADNKYWSCRLSKNEDCSNTVELWLEQKLLSLSCEMVRCEAHIDKKRQFDWFNQQGNVPCEDSFQCLNSQCVDNTHVCDGNDDCGDNSDEEGCPKPAPRTEKIACTIELGYFSCDNKICITQDLVCDGIDDCGDNSDERNCTKMAVYSATNCSLELGTYLCGNRKCISLSSVCDGKDDCGDGTDEGGNCTGSCEEECHPRGVCFRTPKSKECVTACPQGFLETASGCQRSMDPDLSPVSQLVLDIDRLISRHSSAYLLLKTKTISEIAMFSFSTNCSYEYSMLDQITKIKGRTSNLLSRNSTGSL